MDEEKVELTPLADLAMRYENAIELHKKTHEARLRADVAEEDARLKMNDAKRLFNDAVNATKAKRPKKSQDAPATPRAEPPWVPGRPSEEAKKRGQGH